MIFKSILYICNRRTSTYKDKIRLSLTKQPLNDLEWTPTILGVLFFNYGQRQTKYKKRAVNVRMKRNVLTEFFTKYKDDEKFIEQLKSHKDKE